MKITNLKYQNFLPVTTLKNALKAFIILFIGLILTCLATIYTHYDVEEKLNQEFESVCNEIVIKISTRLHAHAQLLRSGSALFEISDTITRQQWKEFNEREKISKNLPGIQGVGFSLLIPKKQLSNHTQIIKKEGFPDYKIRPESDREIYTSIIYLEPFTDRNLRAFGFDMFSEPIRKKAMELSRDSDIATLSGKVILVQETQEDIQAGTLMYVPVYKKGKPIGTIEQRRAAIKGWVYSPYRMNDLMYGILGVWDLKSKDRIRLQIFDEKITNNSLLFDSQIKDSLVNTGLSQRNFTLPIQFNGKKWILNFSQYREQLSFFQSKVTIVLICCILISILMFLLAISLFNTKYKAYQIAERLTKEIKESENKFSLFMDHLPAIVFLKDNEGRTLFVNKYMINAVGATEWIGKNMVEVFPNEFGKKLLENDLRVIQLGYEKIEESIQQLDGNQHFFETQKFIIPRLGQEPFLGGISLDITERKKAENELKYWEDIFKYAKWGIVIGSKDAKTIELMNNEFAQMHGFTIEELTGSTIYELFAPECRENILPQIQIAHEKGHHIWESIHIRKDGSKFPVLIDVTTVKDKQGEIMYRIINIIDLTERKKVEQALQESEERWKFAVEGARDGLWDWNLVTNEVFFSPQWKNMLGFEEHEISNHLDEWSKRVHPDDLQKCYSDIQLHLESKTPNYTNVHRVLCKDGSYKWILDRGKIISFDENNKALRMIGTHTDLTDRIEMEVALKESEAKTSAILNTLPDMMFIQDIEGTYIDFYVPKGVPTFIPPKVFIGQKMQNVLPQELVKAFIPLFEKAIDTKQMQFFEYSLKMPDRVHYFEARTIHFESNKVLSIVRDITQSKDAEELLKLTQKNYETFFNTIDDFLFVLDEQGNIIHTNNTVLKRLGYSKEELVGKSVLQIHPEDRRDEAGKIVEEMLAGKAASCPVPVITKSGIQIAFETRVTKGIWNGRPVIFGVTKDISEIKLSEEKFSKTFHSNTAIMALSLLKDGTFIDINNAFLHGLGYTREEVIGKSSKDLNLFVDMDSREKAIEAAEKAGNEKTGNEKEIEIKVRAKDGSIKFGLFSAENIFIGQEICLLTTMIDITYRKEAEQIIKHQNQELRKLITDKDRFISILAHDLKSPFNSILGFLELLHNKFDTYNTEKIKKQIDIIYSSANQTYNLLNDLLEWARAQSGKLLFKPQKLNLSKECFNVVENLKLHAYNKNIIINNLTNHEYSIFADPDMFKTILRNLVSNAIKFTNNGGHIDIYSEQSPTEITIIVSDTGIGLDPDRIATLFDISQINSTPGTEKEKGTGIGLLLCKEFVEKHGGNLWIESKLGKGSDFKFTLPN
jgi:PAS domain S-box-containing protein